MRTRYRIDTYQKTYFVIDSFEQLIDATRRTSRRCTRASPRRTRSRPARCSTPIRCSIAAAAKAGRPTRTSNRAGRVRAHRAQVGISPRFASSSNTSPVASKTTMRSDGSCGNRGATGTTRQASRFRPRTTGTAVPLRAAWMRRPCRGSPGATPMHLDRRVRRSIVPLASIRSSSSGAKMRVRRPRSRRSGGSTAWIFSSGRWRRGRGVRRRTRARSACRPPAPRAHPRRTSAAECPRPCAARSRPGLAFDRHARTLQVGDVAVDGAQGHAERLRQPAPAARCSARADG